MTRTEFYENLEINALVRNYVPTTTGNGLLFNNVLVHIKNNVVTITDINTDTVIDTTDWKKHFIDNMVMITLEKVIETLDNGLRLWYN